MLNSDGKLYVSPNELYSGSFDLADMVGASGFDPHLLIGVWSGGAGIACATHSKLEFLKRKHIQHFPLRGGLMMARSKLEK